MSTPTYRTLTGTAAERYQDFFVPAIAVPASNELMRAADLRSGQSVLDVACGTGVIARLAADVVGRDGRVTALDLAAEMLEEAARVEHGGADIEWRHGDAQALPFDDGAFDVVVCQMGLMFVDDRAAAVAEMYRVTKPGGRVVVNTPGAMQAPFEALARALSDHVAPELAGFVHVVFSMDDTVGLASSLTDAGFREVESYDDAAALDLGGPAEFLWTYVALTPMAPIVAALPDATKDALEAQLVRESEAWTVDGRVVIEQPMVVAVGHRH